MTRADQSLGVFISYARADGAAFADDLLTGLEVAGFDSFLDRHDIAAGEDWETRLGTLIQAADTVVFVMTPAAVKSERCAWEVQKAQALSKRILPVVAVDVSEADTPEALRRRNYIMFSNGRSFVAGLAELATALRVDVSWIREHTRLGELAARWEGRERSDASLLRGAELDAAKIWLSAWKTPAPAPTDLQRTFIGESEAAESARNSAERQQIEAVTTAQAAREKALARFRRVLVLASSAVILLLAAMAYGGYRLWLVNQDLVVAEKRVGLAEERVILAEENVGLEQKRVTEARTQVVEANKSVENVRAQIDNVLIRLEALPLDRALVEELAELGRRLQERPDIRLTQHFTLANFTMSETGRLRGITNAPDLGAFERLRITAQGLEDVRTVLKDCPLGIPSGYRTPELNAAVGGTLTSAHLSGYSVDIVCPEFGSAYQVARAIQESPVMASIDELILEKGGWVHISFDPQRRQQLVTMFEREHRLIRLQGILEVDENGEMVDSAANRAAAQEQN